MQDKAKVRIIGPYDLDEARAELTAEDYELVKG